MAEYSYWLHHLQADPLTKTDKFFEIEGGQYNPDFQAGTMYIEIKGIESDIWRRTKEATERAIPESAVLIVFGRADKKRGFVTVKEEWLNPEKQMEGVK